MKIYLTTSVRRGFTLGIVAGGAAFLCAFLTIMVPDDFQFRFHGWLLLAWAGLQAIKDRYFKKLLSELSTLLRLRRGTSSASQLEQLEQSMSILRGQASLAWALSVCLKTGVVLAAAILLWDGLPTDARPFAIFAGYAFLIYSSTLTSWARSNFLKLKEASLKEEQRSMQGLDSGVSHDFSQDETAKGHTIPPEVL
jgi:hypothetical protein